MAEPISRSGDELSSRYRRAPASAFAERRAPKSTLPCRAVAHRKRCLDRVTRRRRKSADQPKRLAGGRTAPQHFPTRRSHRVTLGVATMTAAPPQRPPPASSGEQVRLDQKKQREAANYAGRVLNPRLEQRWAEFDPRRRPPGPEALDAGPSRRPAAGQRTCAATTASAAAVASSIDAANRRDRRRHKRRARRRARGARLLRRRAD